MNILWLSRHRPLKIQKHILKEKFGNFNLIEYDKPVSNADEVTKLIKDINARYIIPVLPLSFIMRLVELSKKEDWKVLYSKMDNIHNCSSEQCPDYNQETDTIMMGKDLSTGQVIYRHFRFNKFVILKDIKFVEEDL